MRVWLFSALVVGAVVAGILIFDSDGPAGENGGKTAPAPPSRLSEKEVQTYLKVFPEVQAKLGEIAQDVMVRWSEEDAYPEDEEANRRAQSIVDVVLSKHHLNRKTFNLLRRRVEYAVDVVRWGEEADARNATLDGKIADREGLLEMAEEGTEMRKQLEADLDQLRGQRASAGPPLHDEDRQLLRRYWNELNQVAPRARPR